jgi:hypothetical protein
MESKIMKQKIFTIGMITTGLISSFTTTIKPVQASFGDFMLGVGATIGVGAIIDNNRRAEQERYRPVPPEQEYYRGRQDGINNLKYDNPRVSSDYDRGYEEGLRLRKRGR